VSQERLTFPKALRLLERRDYMRVGHKGEKLMGKYVIIEYLPSAISLTRLGITATKRYGKAHERNYFKRIVREVFRQAQHKIPKGYDCVVKPRSYAKEAAFALIQAELEGLFLTLNLRLDVIDR